MAYENSGRLFKNDRKKSDKHPDYTGDWTDADGNKMRLAAWIKEGRDGGSKWMSITASSMDNQERHDAPEEHSQDDNAPF
jgi:hypothetical protein